MKVMMAAAQTSGTCSVLIGELKPGEGPPPHLHRGFDEYFFVLKGTISLVVGGKQSTVTPGNLIFTPRGATHSFTNVGASPARLLEWTIPAAYSSKPSPFWLVQLASARGPKEIGPPAGRGRADDHTG